MENLKNLFNELERLETLTTSLEDDETKEDAWSEAYAEEFRVHQELVNEIVRLTNLDKDIVKRMVSTKRDELRSLLARVA